MIAIFRIEAPQNNVRCMDHLTGLQNSLEDEFETIKHTITGIIILLDFQKLGLL